MSSELPLHLEALHKAKTESGLTFAQIAEKVGKPEVWTAAVFYGQARPDEETATAIVDAVLPGSNVMLQVRGAVERVAISPDIIVQELSGKGQSNLGVPGMVVRNQTVDSIPRDPVLYRFYEALMVYGQSYKSIIHEKFGDGIMSAIDFRTSVERKPDPKGDRVVIVMDGKFLPYSHTDAWGQ